MKILFLTDNFIPETNAPAYRTYEHCREWIKQGEEVTVITCFPNFPYGEVYEGYKNKLYQVEHIEGIRVVRVWSFMAENKGFVKRILDFLSYMCSSFIAGLFIKTDLIIATSPQFFTAVSGRWLAFWKRKRWVMEVRDLWPESIKVVGAMKDNWAIRFFEYLEHKLYKSAWKIVTATAYIRNTIIEKHNLPSNKIKVIRNGVDLNHFKPLPKDNSLTSKLKLENKFVIGYIGTHGMAHALDFILKAASKIENQKVHFLFVGSGAVKNDLLRLNKNLGLKNTTFIDSVTKAEVKRYISILDMGLVNLIDSPVFLGAIPSKMNELVAMKKPILLGVKGEAKAFVTENDLGLTFTPEDERSFIEAIDKAFHESADFEIDIERVKPIIDRELLALQMLQFIKTENEIDSE
ncbi:MAG TPA: glycosyltransferase family 4 protein [Pricia sp.]|nr:glycosyltransferase family 4 protein [Pricia sp.]